MKIIRTFYFDTRGNRESIFFLLLLLDFEPPVATMKRKNISRGSIFILFLLIVIYFEPQFKYYIYTQSERRATITCRTNYANYTRHVNNITPFIYVSIKEIGAPYNGQLSSIPVIIYTLICSIMCSCAICTRTRETKIKLAYVGFKSDYGNVTLYNNDK